MEWDASSQPAAGDPSPHSAILDTSMVSGNYPPVGLGTHTLQVTGCILFLVYKFFKDSKF